MSKDLIETRSCVRDRQRLMIDLTRQDALVESGARQLIGVFTKWVKETSPSMDAGKLYDQGASHLPSLSEHYRHVCADCKLDAQASRSRRSRRPSSRTPSLSSRICARFPTRKRHRTSRPTSYRPTRRSAQRTSRRACEIAPKRFWWMRRQRWFRSHRRWDQTETARRGHGLTQEVRRIGGVLVGSSTCCSRSQRCALPPSGFKSHEY